MRQEERLDRFTEYRGWDWVMNGPSGKSRKEIFQWWEKRRARFNVIVGVIGVISWLLVLMIGSEAVRYGFDFADPLTLIVCPFVFALLANAFYTVGPLIDVIAYCGHPRKMLFKIGLFFAGFVTVFPGIWALSELIQLK